MLWHKWWLILAAVLVVSAVALVTSSPPANPLYETRTRLLLVTPVSESIIAQRLGSNGILSTNSMSSDALSSLATANDLLQRIISGLDLRDEGSAEVWGVERLGRMITATVESNTVDRSVSNKEFSIIFLGSRPFP